MKRAIIVVGLGFGDESKGATVDSICRKEKVDLVVRFSGGSNCGHNVVTPDGKSHEFSQFCSGTLAGVKGHLGPNVIIDPVAMKKEAEHLYNIGVGNNSFYGVWSMLSVDPNCLVSTRYHRIMNQIHELSRGDDRHGSCGKGIGYTRDYWLTYGMDALFAQDIMENPLQKLRLIQYRYLDYMKKFKIKNKSPHINILIDRLINDSPEEVAIELQNSSMRVYNSYLIKSKDTVVFEGSQGILLDENHGFHPHTTWSTTTSKHAFELIPEGTPTTTIGCIRSYMTRHGNGPLPTYDKDVTEILPDPGNTGGEWQGKMRCGYLDLPLIRYAVECNRGIDGLSVSHLDQCNFVHSICDKYHYPVLSYNPITNLDIQRDVCVGLWEEERIGRMKYINIINTSDVLNAVKEIAPVMIEGYGRTSGHRVFTEEWK